MNFLAMQMMTQDATVHAPPAATSSTATSSADLASLRHKLSASDLLAAVKTISNRQLVSQIGVVYKFIIPDDEIRTYYMDLKHGMQLSN